MKVAPVSADLLIKLALGGAVVIAVVYGARKAWDSLPGLPEIPDWLEAAGDGVADFMGNTLGGNAHITNPANFPPLDNQWGIYLTPQQKVAYDTQVANGTFLGSVLDFISRIGNQVPPSTSERPAIGGGSRGFY